MLCIRPFRLKGAEFGCGRCKACRVNRRNTWTSRMLLELMVQGVGCFVTLTYKDAPSELVPLDLRNFLKRLRHVQPFRFYAVGEYGSRGGRPHFHVALFGIGIERAGDIARAWRGHLVPCRAVDVPASSVGGVHVGELNKDSAQYLTKYVLKSPLELARFDGKHPEFARMSLKPGIGHGSIAGIVENLVKANGGSCDPVDIPDVPVVVRYAGKQYPLGSYLRRGMRKALGRAESAPSYVVAALEAESKARSDEDRGLRERRRQRAYDNLEGRLKIQKSKESL